MSRTPSPGDPPVPDASQLEPLGADPRGVVLGAAPVLGDPGRTRDLLSSATRADRVLPVPTGKVEETETAQSRSARGDSDAPWSLLRASIYIQRT